MNLTDRMTPTDVCRLITGEHRDMRTKLDELSRLAKTLLTAGPSELARALRFTHAVLADLKSQIALEAKVLLPALRDADAWGTVRADRLIAQLRVRRRELRTLRKSAAKPQHGTLGAELDQFIDARRSSMARAERESVNPGVLRDDVIGIDTFGG